MKNEIKYQTSIFVRNNYQEMVKKIGKVVIFYIYIY